MVGRCFQEENESDQENTESTEDQRPEYAGFTQHGFRADKPPQRTEQFGIAYAGTKLLPGQEFTQQRYEREHHGGSDPIHGSPAEMSSDEPAYDTCQQYSDEQAAHDRSHHASTFLGRR